VFLVGFQESEIRYMCFVYLEAGVLFSFLYCGIDNIFDHSRPKASEHLWDTFVPGTVQSLSV
jgi:hypothetical protein